MRKSQNTLLQANASKPSGFSFLDESLVTEWLAKHGKNALYILGAILVLALVIYRFSASYTAHGEKEYLSAAKNFAQFEKDDPEKKEIALKELAQQLQSMPELQAAYGGTLAQTLLSRGQTAEATPFVNATLKRTRSDNLPFYGAFGSTSLLIAQNDYKQALEKAVALQQQMRAEIAANNGEKTRSFGDALFALNMLRIVLLHQQLGQTQAELDAWKEWKQYAGLESVSPDAQPVITPEAFRRVIQQFAIGNVSLVDYIASRQKILTTQTSN